MKRSVYVIFLLSLLLTGCEKYEMGREYLTKDAVYGTGEIVRVSSISLSSSEISLTKGGTHRLTVIINPSNASNTSITWSSSNTRVATVSDGVVTAVTVGTAIITASAADGSGVKTTCVVTVGNKPVTSITLSHTSVNLVTGEKKQIIATPFPSDADNTSIRWASNNTSVATVNEGLVTAVSAGTATITATAADGSGVKATCEIVVSPLLVTSISLSSNTLDMYVKEEKTLTAIINPTNADNKNLEWTSNKESVASVENGKVKAIAEGVAVITAKSTDGSNIKATCVVNVASKLVTSIRLYSQSQETLVDEESNTPLDLYVGESTSIEADVYPYNATNTTLSWTSNNESIATVSSGRVKAVSAGTTTIVVSALDGSGIKAVCSVNVVGTGVNNGHKYVDMGLSVKWAYSNLGASSPEKNGNYYAWGETTTKSRYDWSTYKYGNGTRFTKYNYDSNYGIVDNKMILDLSDDAANVNWGVTWRIPTCDELNEFLEKCTSKTVKRNGVFCVKFTAPNGNYIFLPYASLKNGTSVQETDFNEGYYWTSSVLVNYDVNPSTYCLYLLGGKGNTSAVGRSCGLSIRPVCP